MLLVPSVEVTQGDPHPFIGYVLHPLAMVGRLVEGRPIERHPVIARIAAKYRARLKTNHCFTAAPGGRLESVSGANERTGAVTGDAASAPYTAADGAGGPCCHTGRIIYRHSHQPAMKDVAI